MNFCVFLFLTSDVFTVENPSYVFIMIDMNIYSQILGVLTSNGQILCIRIPVRSNKMKQVFVFFQNEKRNKL